MAEICLMKACAFSFFSMSAARVYQQQDSLAAATRRKPVRRVGALLTDALQSTNFQCCCGKYLVVTPDIFRYLESGGKKGTI